MRCCTIAPASYQPRVLFTILTTESISGTSIKTPTTVASAAPELKPDMASLLADQLFARAQQRAHILRLGFRHEARSDQTMSQQMSRSSSLSIDSRA